MAEVIVVEDDAPVRHSVERYLTHSGHSVRGAGSAAEMRTLFQQRPADVIVLDVGLPDQDGTAIARDLKGSSPVGIVMLTGRGGTANKVEGFECGADHYLVKPVDLEELQAVIRSLLRRLPAGCASDAAAPVWCLDAIGRKLLSPADIAVPLTGAEFQLLSCVMAEPGTPVSREVISCSLGYDRTRFLSSIESVVARLRKKVQSVTGQTLPIRPVRGVGYVFADPAQRA